MKKLLLIILPLSLMGCKLTERQALDKLYKSKSHQPIVTAKFCWDNYKVVEKDTLLKYIPGEVTIDTLYRFIDCDSIVKSNPTDSIGNKNYINPKKVPVESTKEKVIDTFIKESVIKVKETEELVICEEEKKELESKVSLYKTFSIILLILFLTSILYITLTKNK